MQFTEEQLKVINATEGNVLVNASAGSGKTSVLSESVARIVENEIYKPSELLILSFSNAAANTIKDRLKERIGSKSDNVYASTMHAFAYRMLKKYKPNEYARIEIAPSWFLFQTAQNLVELPSRYNENGLNMSLDTGELLSFISYQKANRVNSGEPVIINERVFYAEKEEMYKLQEAYDTYCNILKSSRYIDFDDMLLEFYNALQDEEFAEKISNQYKRIFVDEAQDTSFINLEILKIIAGGKLFYVGDFKQGIYSFNNSEVDNILEFEKHFKDVQVMELSYNFRSHKRIVNFADNIVFSSPDERYQKFSRQKAYSTDDGDSVEIHMFDEDRDEMEFVADEVVKLIEQGVDMNDIAILHRTNNGLLNYETIFSEREIPVRLSSGKSFYDRNEIVDLMAYLQLSQQGSDTAIRRIVNKPTRYISNNIMQQLNEYAYKREETLEQALRSFDTGRFTRGFNKLKYDLEDIREHRRENVGEIIARTVDIIRYDDYVMERSSSAIDAMDRVESLDRLIEVGKDFKSVKEFFAYVGSVKENANNHPHAVNLSTVHSSKGMEYDYVFVVGVTNKNYPHDMDLNQYEESRRLLYVATSRAKKKVTLTLARTLSNDGERTSFSPFLFDAYANKFMDDDKNTIIIE